MKIKQIYKSLKQTITNWNQRLNCYRWISLVLALAYLVSMVFGVVYLGEMLGRSLVSLVFPSGNPEMYFSIYVVMTHQLGYWIVIGVLVLLGLLLWGRSWAVQTILVCCTLVALSVPAIPYVLRSVGILPESYLLEVIGYNYTDRSISIFSIAKGAGGSLTLSTPTSGGGSAVCCIKLSRSKKTPFLEIGRAHV